MVRALHVHSPTHSAHSMRTLRAKQTHICMVCKRFRIKSVSQRINLNELGKSFAVSRQSTPCECNIERTKVSL